MTPRQTDLVSLSFAQVLAHREAAGRLFTDRLFKIAPDLRPLASADIGPRLVDTLGVMVAGLTDLPKLLPVLSRMASRHAKTGMRPEHYPLVGEVLLFTLQRTLGRAFTDEVAEAWTVAFDALSHAMLDAACPERVVAQLSAAE